MSSLQAFEARCRAAWPELEGSPEDLVQKLDPAALERLHVEDLYLAFRCGQGQDAALRAFERLHLSKVADFIRHIDASADFADEVRQRLREKLFVAPGRKIDEYGGTGALGGWLRVVTVRLALDLKRREPAHRAADEDLGMAGLDPELDYIKATYREELQSALRTTLEALDSQERAVLRLHYFEGCNLDEIGALYDVHRATAARWLERARARILGETRRLLAERLRLRPSELDSLIDLMQSRLDLSLRRLLP